MPGLRQAALIDCRVCGRELPADHFPAMPWAFTWAKGKSTWCDECIVEAFNLREGGFAGTLRELKERTRALVIERWRSSSTSGSQGA
jgi:hypothetical protein